jgi:hypothetical protein
MAGDGSGYRICQGLDLGLGKGAVVDPDVVEKAGEEVGSPAWPSRSTRRKIYGKPSLCASLP